MAFEVRLKPVERLLFHGGVVAVGMFRCGSGDALFRDSGPCSHHTFVFPRTMTEIRRADGTTYVGNPGSMGMYNEGQRYTRLKVSEIDASDWFTVADDVLFELMAECDAKSTEVRPFRRAEVSCDRVSFIEQRALFDRLASGGPMDPLHVEETALRVIRRVLSRAFAAKVPALRGSRKEGVEHARRIITKDPTAKVSLRALAIQCGMSPFQLCHHFRASTGKTVTRYRHELRMRLALDRLRDTRDGITPLALELGYSSHSHFTYVFRHYYGVPPAHFRSSIP